MAPLLTVIQEVMRTIPSTKDLIRHPAYCYQLMEEDAAGLDEVVTFLAGRPLGVDEHEYYELPTVATETAS